MAKLPDGWIFRPKMKNAVTITIEKTELIICEHCKHWIPGRITDTDDFIPPRCEINGGGWSADEYCSNAEQIEA